MVDTVYRNLRQSDGSSVDLSIAGGCILAIEPAGRAAPAQAEIVEGNGRLLLPALVESHAHLDKTLWGLPWRPHSAGPSLKDLIANERRVLREVKIPSAKRSGALLENCIARGSLHIRSHIDIDPEIGLSHVEALLGLREAYRDVVEMQFVAFPQTGMLIQPGTAEVMERALTLDFLPEARNLILMGTNGLGKTMIAQNICHQAVLAGHSVLFRSAAALLEELHRQTPEGRHRKLRTYANVGLLCIDEVGYLSFDDKSPPTYSTKSSTGGTSENR